MGDCSCTSCKVGWPHKPSIETNWCDLLSFVDAALCVCLRGTPAVFSMFKHQIIDILAECFDSQYSFTTWLGWTIRWQVWLMERCLKTFALERLLVIVQVSVTGFLMRMTGKSRLAHWNALQHWVERAWLRFLHGSYLTSGGLEALSDLLANIIDIFWMFVTWLIFEGAVGCWGCSLGVESFCIFLLRTVVFCCSARSQSTWSSWEGPVGSLSDRSNTSCFDMFWSVLLLWLRDDSLIPNSGLTVLILNVLDMLQSKDSCKDFAHFVKLKRVSVYLGCFRQVYNWPPNHQSHHFLVLQDRRSSMRESCSADSLLSVAACLCLDFACVHRTRVTFMWILHINLRGNFACAYCGYTSCKWVPSYMHLRESNEFRSKLMVLVLPLRWNLFFKNFRGFRPQKLAEGLRKGFLRGSSQKHYK